jgi:hypothetical protein
MQSTEDEKNTWGQKVKKQRLKSLYKPIKLQTLW